MKESTESSSTEENENPFSYSKINGLSIDDEVKANGYKAYYTVEPETMKNFTAFSRIIPKGSEALKILKAETSRGWKLHIAIDATKNDENIAKAWNVIVPVLMEHKITSSKIIREEVRQRMIKEKMKKTSIGKEVTVYTFKDIKGEKEWAKFFNDLESALDKANIRPSIRHGKDTGIKGSRYFGVRNDKQDSTFKYTIKNNSNPFEGIKVENRNYIQEEKEEEEEKTVLEKEGSEQETESEKEEKEEKKISSQETAKSEDLAESTHEKDVRCFHCKTM